MQAIWKRAVAVITFCLLLFSQLALADFPRGPGSRGLVHFKPYEGRPEKYSQNHERDDWERLPGKNSPLSLIDWRLVVNPRSGDQYMDKRIIGTVKNNSEKEFSEVKIEFMVFDEEGNQIGIVFSNFYQLKPRGIWKFEIPVTSDVGKAELKGLYVPANELK